MYLGVDYGSHKVGLAISDARGVMAFPLEQVPTKEALQRIEALVREKKIEVLVMGDTLAASGRENEVTDGARRFAARLQEKTQLPMHLVPEHGTSGAARATLGEGVPRGVLQNKRRKEDAMHDARAAALILQRFIDVHRKTT